CLVRLRDEAAEHLPPVSVAPDWADKTDLSADALARRIAEIAKTMHGGPRITRVMVCDNDVDLSDMRDLMWAWNSRCHPENGRSVLYDQPANPIEPMY